MSSRTQRHAYYLKEVWHHPREVVETLAHQLKRPELHDVELLVGMGISGTVLLPWLSDMTGIPFAIVRKKTSRSSCHSGIGVEGYPDGSPGKYVVIDDLTSTGATVHKILDEMWRWECAGVLLYSQRCYPETCVNPKDCKCVESVWPMPEYRLLDQVVDLLTLKKEEPDVFVAEFVG